jgi:hypothetical protein
VSDAYWRNQRTTKTKPPTAHACPDCGHRTYSTPPSALHHTCDFRSLDMTSGDIDAFLGKTEPPRDRWGRPIIKTPEGKTKAYTRCTTYVGALEDNYNLGLWQQRMVALGLAQRDDLLLAAAALTAENKDDLNKICEAAREAAAASAGATIGTALHKMCERLDRGEKFLIPSAAKADIEAYKQTTKHLTWQRIEELLVNDTLEIAGTPDRIGGVPGTKHRVYDIKTGSITYGIAKIAMQLAVYAHSQAYDVDLGTREPLDIDLDVATIIHLPAGEGRCELVDVDIAQGWEGVRLAGEVRAWRKRKNFTPPMQTLVTLPDLIALAPDRDALLALRAEHLTEWDDTLTELAKQRIAALTAA